MEIEKYLQVSLDRKIRQAQRREKELKNAGQFFAGYREGLQELQSLLQSFKILKDEKDERQEDLF